MKSINEKYYCKCCNYNAKQKCNYEKHLKTKKHLIHWVDFLLTHC